MDDNNETIKMCEVEGCNSKIFCIASKFCMEHDPEPPDNACILCLDPVDTPLKPCNHIIHMECIYKTSKDTCPVCTVKLEMTEEEREKIVPKEPEPEPTIDEIIDAALQGTIDDLDLPLGFQQINNRFQMIGRTTGSPTNFQIVVERQPLLGYPHPLNILMRQRQRETRHELQRLRAMFNIQDYDTNTEEGKNEEGKNEEGKNEEGKNEEKGRVEDSKNTERVVEHDETIDYKEIARRGLELFNYFNNIHNNTFIQDFPILRTMYSSSDDDIKELTREMTCIMDTLDRNDTERDSELLVLLRERLSHIYTVLEPILGQGERERIVNYYLDSIVI